MDPERLVMIFPSEMACVAEVGAYARAFCAQLPLSETDAAEIELCVVEAVNNAIEHAYGERPDQQIILTATRSDAEVAIEISDRGKPMPAALLERDPLSRLNFDPSEISSLPERGLGLAIIKQVMDEVSYRSEDGMNTLRLTHRFRQASSPVVTK